MEKNSRFTHLWEEIEREHAEAAVRNEQELNVALNKFKRLEEREVQSIEKLQVT